MARARPAKAKRRVAPPAGFAMIPVTAVGRTAGAVGGLADSGLVVGMTRGRLWIAVLGLLLGGIVAINVWGLSMSASSSGTAAAIGELERENSILRERLAERLSSAAVAERAAELGFGPVSTRALRDARPDSGDAARAAERISSGDLTAISVIPIAAEPLAPLEAVAPGSLAPEPQPTDPAATAPADPAPAPADPAIAPAPAAEPPPPTGDPAGGGAGGIAP